MVAVAKNRNGGMKYVLDEMALSQNLIPPVAHLKITQYIENKTLRHIILWLKRISLKFKV
jgi:hypothetical protein